MLTHRIAFKKNESGAVFFYILLAIALLAALTYAVSRGNRGGISTLTTQQAKLAAQEIIEYGNTVATAVQKLKLRGCTDTEISFEGLLGAGSYINPNAPNDETCHVFSQAGASAVTKDFIDQSWLDTSFEGQASYQDFVVTGDVRVLDLGSTETELLLYVPYIKNEVCNEINRALTIIVDETDIIGGGVSAFTGAYVASAIPNLGDEETSIAGETAFCVQRAAGSWRYSSQVLIAR